MTDSPDVFIAARACSRRSSSDQSSTAPPTTGQLSRPRASSRYSDRKVMTLARSPEIPKTTRTSAGRGSVMASAAEDDRVVGVTAVVIRRASIGEDRSSSPDGDDARASLAQEPLRMTVQLLVYAFGPDAEYEGRLVGALERIESGGALRILEAMFITTEAGTGELAALDLASRGAGSLVAPLIGFRLDEAERRRATAKALNAGGNRLGGDTLRRLATGLAPGAALVAVLVEHTWAVTLDDAISRTGGRPVVSDFVEATSLKDVAPD